MKEQLGFANRCQFRNGFHFDDDLLLDQDVDAVGAIDLHRTVLNRHFALGFHRQPRHAEFVEQAGHINRLQQAWTQDPVNLDRSADYAPGQGVELRECRRAHAPERARIVPPQKLLQSSVDSRVSQRRRPRICNVVAACASKKLQGSKPDAQPTRFRELCELCVEYRELCVEFP
jgi:hypothetical protein